jgi:hypothetical protein
MAERCEAKLKERSEASRQSITNFSFLRFLLRYALPIFAKKLDNYRNFPNMWTFKVRAQYVDILSVTPINWPLYPEG